MTESPNPPRRRGIGAAGILKVFLSGAISGSALTAYAGYQYALAPFIAAVIDRGACGERDRYFGWPHMYDCRDSFAAMEINQRAIERDRQDAAILADMRVSEPGKARPASMTAKKAPRP